MSRSKSTAKIVNGDSRQSASARITVAPILSKSRVGLIVPSSNTVMEPDLHRMLGAYCVVSTTRIFLESVTREAEIRMLEQELPKAIELVHTTAPDITVFGCTSAGALGTLAHDEAIGRMIASGTNAGAITVLQAVLAQLRTIAPKRLAVFTPYIQDLTSGVAACLTEAGFPPVKAAGMGIRENLDIGRVVPERIVDFVESQMTGIAPDCVFLSCTNWRAIEAIPLLEGRRGIPVISSNQAVIKWLASA